MMLFLQGRKKLHLSENLYGQSFPQLRPQINPLPNFKLAPKSRRSPPTLDLHFFRDSIILNPFVFSRFGSFTFTLSIRSRHQIWKSECPVAHERTFLSTTFTQFSSSVMGNTMPSADFNAFQISLQRLASHPQNAHFQENAPSTAKRSRESALSFRL